MTDAKIGDTRVGDWYEKDGVRRRVWKIQMDPRGRVAVIYSQSPSSERFYVLRESWNAWLNGAKLIKRSDRDPGEPAPSTPPDLIEIDRRSQP